MCKKHISIIGACTSRNLFNSYLMKNKFEVDCYAFQRCTWDLFGDDLNIPKEDIFNLNLPEFTARMLWYGLDKVTLQEIKNFKSEYLMIDLHQLRGQIYKVKYDNKVVYFQRSGNLDPKDIEELKTNYKYSGITIENVENIDEEIIKDGLNKLANWAKENYDESKIIIHFCKTATQYRKSYEKEPYVENFIEANNKRGKIVKYYTDYLSGLLPNSIYLENDDNVVAVYNGNDDIKNKYPPADHLSGIDCLKTSIKLLKRIDEDFSNKKWEKLLEKEYNFTEELLFRNVNKINSQKEHILDLNNYFKNLSNLKDYIVVISVKDEASTNSKYFRAKSKLKISFNIKYRDSYIAIIDNSKDFVYENSSSEKISYLYEVENNNIEIQSAGFLCGSHSSIKVNGVEYSPNHRGLNIVLIRKSDFVVVERVGCDLIVGKELYVEKYY